MAPVEGRIAVRATDGLGEVQTDEGTHVTPDGDAGRHTITVAASATCRRCWYSSLGMADRRFLHSVHRLPGRRDDRAPQIAPIDRRHRRGEDLDIDTIENN